MNWSYGSPKNLKENEKERVEKKGRQREMTLLAKTNRTQTNDWPEFNRRASNLLHFLARFLSTFKGNSFRL